MKMGFRIVYHKSICLNEIQEFLEKEKKHFCSPSSYKVGYSHSSSFYRRGVFGFTVDEQTLKYTFRRLVKNRRIFGVVPIILLERVDGKELELKQCMCGEHRGGQKVKIKGGFREGDFVTYFEKGEIKG